MNINKLSWGLFIFHGKNWWRNLKDIPIFFKRIFFHSETWLYPCCTVGNVQLVYYGNA